MANRFEQWLAEHRDGFTLQMRPRVADDGRFVCAAELEAHPSLNTRPAYSVSKQQLEEWVTFLRTCGGFEVC